MQEEKGQAQPQLYGTQYFSVRIALTGRSTFPTRTVNQVTHPTNIMFCARTWSPCARLPRSRRAHLRAMQAERERHANLGVGPGCVVCLPSVIPILGARVCVTDACLKV